MPQPRLQSDVSGLVRRTVLGLLAVAFVLVIHRRFWTGKYAAVHDLLQELTEDCYDRLVGPAPVQRSP
jgi:hypothetical protein